MRQGGQQPEAYFSFEVSSSFIQTTEHHITDWSHKWDITQQLPTMS